MTIQGHVFWGQWEGDKGLNNTIQYTNIQYYIYLYQAARLI